MNFKEIFIKLTEFTTPFGYESELEPLLPSGWRKDSIGNYIYEIGNSETLFTSHLDTSSKEKTKINHVIEGDIIKTDGTTILGGDNKAGCCVLFYMIENNFPGTYYFFLGEEMAVDDDYPHGSLLAIEETPDFFKKFKRIISFDRKETGQLITRQLGRNCCSEEFADTLIEEFGKNGIEYNKDRTGYYTDSAFFGNLIPEIVNLSVGVWNEHTNREYVDIKYIESVAKAAIKVDWESLPTVNKIESKYQLDTRKDVESTSDLSDDQNLFKEIFTIMDDLYFVCHEFRSYKNYLLNFKPGRVYHFTKWHEDEDISISIEDGKITCNDIQYDNINEFKKSIGIEKMDQLEFSKLMRDEFLKNGNKLSDARFNYLLYLKGGDLNTLKSNTKSLGYELTQIGKGYEIVKESRVIKKYYLFIEKYKTKF